MKHNVLITNSKTAEELRNRNFFLDKLLEQLNKTKGFRFGFLYGWEVKK